MPQDASWDFDRQTNALFIHFDVDDHHLKLDTFIRTADSVRRIVAALDQSLFGSTLTYELLVLPPEDGTFLQKLTVVLTSAAAMTVFIDSDTPAGFIKGLTGRPLAEWAEELGEVAKDGVIAAFEGGEIAQGEAPSIKPTTIDHSHLDRVCRIGERLLIALTSSILEKDNDELRQLGLEETSLLEALDARADFYAACYNDGDVRRVGFTPDDYFPIPRNSFAGRAQKPARKEDEEEPPEWAVSVERVLVSSPNWDREDQRTRKWKGQDVNHHPCYFVIDDAEFWHRVKLKDLPTDVSDSLTVQWASRIVDGKVKERRVLRVLEFNGKKFATPLPPDAINAILGSHTPSDGAISERDLFDWRKDS
jgi:hypothetical protein